MHLIRACFSSLDVILNILAFDRPYKRCNNTRNDITGNDICRLHRRDRTGLYTLANISWKRYRRYLRRFRWAGESGDLFHTDQLQADRNVHVDAVFILGPHSGQGFRHIDKIHMYNKWKYYCFPDYHATMIDRMSSACVRIRS